MKDPSCTEALRPSTPRPSLTDCVLAVIAAGAVAVLSCVNAPAGYKADSELEYFDLLGFHDPYFNFHRTRLALDEFPALPLRDRFIFYPEAYPDGHAIPAAPGLVWLAAAWCKLAGTDSSTILGVARCSAWLPPLLGALAVLVVFMASRALFPAARGAPLLAAVLLLTIPTHHFFAQYGRLDHHVAEPITSWLVMAFALKAALGRARRPQMASATAGILAVLAVLFWPAALMPYLVVHLVMAVLAVLRGPAVVARASEMAATALACSVLLLPVMPHASCFDIWTISLLQPTLFAVAFGIWVTARLFVATGGLQRVMITAPCAALLGGALLFPPLRAALVEGFRWVLRDDPVISIVPESRPLPFNLELLFQLFGPHLVLLPAALMGAALLAILRREQRAEWSAATVWLGAALALTLVQFRFSTYVPIPLATTLGLLAAAAWKWCRERSPVPRTLALAGMIGLGAATLTTGVERAVFCQPGSIHKDPEAEASFARESAYHQCALFLRGPETRYRLARPSSEALPRPVAVDLFGHGVIALGERPVIASGFGSNLEAHYANACLFTFTEKDALRLCEKWDIEYYLACWLPPETLEGYRRMAAERGELAGQSLNDRLFVQLGMGGLPEPGAEPQRAVMGFRAVFEPDEEGWVRVFQRVRGARLRIKAQSGTLVGARLPLKTGKGSERRWQDLAKAGLDGLVDLVLPYATTEPNGQFVAQQPYSIRVGPDLYHCHVTEEDVIKGEQLDPTRLRRVERRQ
ncbi:MAG: STT3 domain-containing protein [Planctomycetota bacterium]